MSQDYFAIHYKSKDILSVNENSSGAHMMENWQVVTGMRFQVFWLVDISWQSLRHQSKLYLFPLRINCLDVRSLVISGISLNFSKLNGSDNGLQVLSIILSFPSSWENLPTGHQETNRLSILLMYERLKGKQTSGHERLDLKGSS